MRVQFATCVPKTALEYIQRYHPRISRENIPLLIGLVEKDICRVTDPAMYNRAELIAGQRYTEDNDAAIQEAVKQLNIAILRC